MSAEERTLIGVVERLQLPEWGVGHLRVKIDTGARTSALHVDEVEVISETQVRFWVVLDRRKPERRVMVEAPIARWGRVRSSSGRAQKRIFVRTRMRLGAVDKEIEISLASRDPMIFRMLLGRSGLGSDFFVDPSGRYLHSPSKPPSAKTASSKKKTAKKKSGTKPPSAKKASGTKKSSAKKKSAKKSSAKKSSAKKSSAKKSSAKKTSAKKTSAKKTSAKKSSAKKTSAKKKSAKKKSAKKTSAKKTSAKKKSAKKKSAKKTSAKRKVSPKKRRQS